MAKKKTKSKSRSESTYQGMNRDELARALGFHELTYEACIEGLLEPAAEEESLSST